MKRHPFRLLLYLEWVLLVIALVVEIVPPEIFKQPRQPWFSLLMLVSFGLMGLVLPTTGKLYKILYVGVEVVLVLLTSHFGGGRLLPFVCLVMAMRGCMMFTGRGRLMVAAVALVVFSFGQIRNFQNIDLTALPRIQGAFYQFQIGSTAIFVLCLAFILLLVNAVLSERQSRTELGIANDRLREYALRLEDRATLQERNRIARDIHDSLGHSLTALNVQLETALKLWQSDPMKAASFLAEAKRLGSMALQEVRRSVAAMRTDPLENKSLEGAIASLCEEFAHTTGIVPTCDFCITSTISTEVMIAVYRIMQESLTNICKHARDGATPLSVEIVLREQMTHLHVQIKDNGRGFQPKQIRTGFGLQGMRERAIALEGQLTIQTAPGEGCTIDAYVPLARLVA